MLYYYFKAIYITYIFKYVYICVRVCKYIYMTSVSIKESYNTPFLNRFPPRNNKEGFLAENLCTKT